MKLKSRSVPKRVRGKRGPRPRNSVTLKMVAREAGVSASTASRIINRTVNVSDELRLAVEAAIAKFNFRPNAAARGLALGRTLTIGVISQAMDSPFYGEAIVAIERRLQPLGYAPLFMSGNWQEQEEIRCMEELINRGVDGIIMFAGCLGDAALKAYAQKVPIVVTGRLLRAKGLVSMQVDDRHGAILAMRHLLELGHRRIAFLAGLVNHPDANERLAGYKGALAAAGIAFDPLLVLDGDFHEEGGMRAVYQLMDSGVKFTAMFCVNDQTAYGACLALVRRGLGVPKDVSVVGFDDLPASAYRIPPLTCVRQSVQQLGERSAEAILQLIAGRRPQITLPAVELVVRESTSGVSR
ncbi:MAG TPA: LacI family DNA-binding transcriptional regulator [Steroidobacteraceae bacterium]|nr:LacI family DNA-binding transcriptional regulator [Steroidobacteraceae bacterium]